MEKIIFDTGVKEFEVNNGGVLRFNPSDPNVYARFMDLTSEIGKIEKDMAKRAEKLENENEEKRGAGALRIMRDADTKVKQLLAEVFGSENDFGKLFEGVNLMAVASNGERVVTNFFTAIEPVITAGVQACVSDEVAAAKTARAERKG